MGILSRVESRMEDTVEGAANRIANSPISPVQIAKQCEKQMKRNKMVGAGKQYAPTLYTILVNSGDDSRLFGYYPTLAGETETYIYARAQDLGLSMDGRPLVRFIAADELKHGKFDVIAECVASPIIERLRDEEMEHYGIKTRNSRSNYAPAPAYNDPYEDDFYEDDGFGQYTGGADDFADSAYAGAAMNLPTSAPLVATLTERATGKTHKLSASNIKLGRETDNDIVVPDMGASRYHAEIKRTTDGWTLVDSNSTNGTLVNNIDITSRILHSGDVITIGTTEYEFKQVR